MTPDALQDSGMVTGTGTDPITMRAITQDRYGGSEVLRLAQASRPTVNDGQALIRVHVDGP